VRLFDKLLQTLGIGVAENDKGIPPQMNQTTVPVPTPVTTSIPTPVLEHHITELPKKDDYPLDNKVSGLSETRDWRSSLEGGEERVFKGVAVVMDKREFKVRIDVFSDAGEQTKLGYLGAAASFQMACAKVNSDSDMGRVIAQKEIPCRVLIYRGDIDAPIETDRYSYAYTDALHRVKAAIEKGKKPKTKPSDTQPQT
jgi:hypothetical protein